MNIYFEDLKESKQERLLNYFEISSPEVVGWDEIPLTEIDCMNNPEVAHL